MTETPNQFSDFQLLQNYPNPFNPTTNIDFYVGRDGMVRVEVFDITGRKVTTLVNEYQSKGWHSVHWNVDDSQATGVFICRLEAGGFIGNRKLMLMK
ncbi:MAG: T9SS type A sorting domain-containing protein [bacterium]